MMVLVDTPVWSLALRRRTVDLSAGELKITLLLQEQVRDSRAQLLGPVRQEILSGIREEAQFRRIRNHLQGFGDVPLRMQDYEEAAALTNRCRSSGIAGSPVDMLICSVSLRNGWQIFTTDRDFSHYARVLPIQLFLH
jgi:predicted nucleic acid-binding protein